MKKKPIMNQARFDAIKALLNSGVNYRTISKVMTSSQMTVKFVDQAESLEDYKQIQHDFYAVLPSRVKNYNDSPHKELPDNQEAVQKGVDKIVEMARNVEQLQVTLDQVVSLLQIMTEVKEEKTRRFF